MKLPLKAKLNGDYIYAFNYDNHSWDGLKKENVLMHCCENKAVLKRSKRGTLFFSHYRKGNCTSSPESAEHIYLKFLISRIAVKCGWDVTTEHEGIAPCGEKWIADVYCQKGNAKVAFEVQWSHQTNEEFQRRQEKYCASGVRTAWLFKLKSNKSYMVWDIPYEFKTPVFGMKCEAKNLESLVVSQFDQPIEPFVEGVLRGKLKWCPQLNQKLKAEVIPHFEKCWKCGKVTGVILGVLIKDLNGKTITFEKFSDDGIPEFILHYLDFQSLVGQKIGAIKRRYSKTRGESYLSNGCSHCDSIMGNFFLFQSLSEYHDELPDPISSFEFIYDGKLLHISGDWYFDGKSSKHFF